MSPDILSHLLPPSPILHWLLMTLPLTIGLAGIFGALEHEVGNRRLAVWAIVLLLWLFLPISFHDPLLSQLSSAISILGWLGLVKAWAQHVWQNRPTPIWTHALVIAQLVAIASACGLALSRAFGQVA